MPCVHREGDSTTGHDCFPPTIPASWSSSVTVNNKGVVRKGDSIVPHCCVVCHSSSYNGSHTVTVDGMDIQVEGDPIGCSDQASAHSPDVSVDG